MYSVSCIIVNDFEGEILLVVNFSERQTFHRSILVVMFSKILIIRDGVIICKIIMHNTFEDNPCHYCNKSGKLCAYYACHFASYLICLLHCLYIKTIVILEFVDIYKSAQSEEETIINTVI